MLCFGVRSFQFHGGAAHDHHVQAHLLRRMPSTQAKRENGVSSRYVPACSVRAVDLYVAAWSPGVARAASAALLCLTRLSIALRAALRLLVADHVGITGYQVDVNVGYDLLLFPDSGGGGFFH